MRGLGRINLLVGTNNSGKTSILEALELLVSRGSFKSIWTATARRGEKIWFEDDARRYSEGDVSHLFYGHGFEAGSEVTVAGKSESGEEKLRIQVLPSQEESPDLLTEQNTVQTNVALSLSMSWGNGTPSIFLQSPLSPRGGLSSRSVSRTVSEKTVAIPVQFISTASLSSDEVLTLFDEIVLTPEEDLLIDALCTIEPNIERIASIGSDRGRMANYPKIGGMVVKMKGLNNRIPIGSMGDGIWRMLGIALSLVNAENGILLIDEIDTGLHYSVLSKMWHLVQQTAQRLNIQVFATTHSRDCYESLASISNDFVSVNSSVTIQRVERDIELATAFTEQEIVAAAERGIEVR
jgi:ABC-type branched-subunit amino acid transport system ATPase component